MINFCRPGKLAILSTAVLLATSTTVVAQRYQVLQPRMDEARARSEGGKVAALLRSATSLNDAQKKQLDSYFLGYFFPRMTRTDAESLGELAEDRQRFFRQYMGFAKSEQVRNHLVKTTFKAMGKIALGTIIQPRDTTRFLPSACLTKRRRQPATMRRRQCRCRRPPTL